MEIDEINTDYAFKEPMPGTKVNNEEERDDGVEGASGKSLPILVCSSRKTKWISCTVVAQKGVCPFAVQMLAKEIGDMMGYRRTLMKNDQEEAIMKLREAVGQLKNIEIIKKESPVGGSASNGYIESIVKVCQKQIRTLKIALESRIGSKVEKDNDILPWLIRHAGALLSRYKRGEDAKTAHERLRGRPFEAKVTEFGECVRYLKVKCTKRGKLDGCWGTGVWL